MYNFYLSFKENLKLNNFKKIIINFTILLFITNYIGCNQNQCWVCKGDGKNECAICYEKEIENCIFCNNIKESICTFCTGKGELLKK